ncbi:hypothetical protein ACH5RR_002520 [Cinchona calisaya]|uniref:Uncharacterized protein n=1 Tax=Cinchona calisaya TaxID=153742 RepID=A0ABD3B6S4_9GENT
MCQSLAHPGAWRLAQLERPGLIREMLIRGGKGLDMKRSWVGGEGEYGLRKAKGGRILQWEGRGKRKWVVIMQGIGSVVEEVGFGEEEMTVVRKW